MRNNLQPKCRMPWERAGVTLQGPGLSNCASLFHRLFCFSTHFTHYCAFLPPLHCWNRAAPTATFYCCAGCSGITALQSRATAPHCCNSYCTSAHLCKTRPPSSQKCNTKLYSFIRSMQMTNFNSTVTSALSQFHS